MDKDVEELLSRGVAEVIDKENLTKKLASGKKLRIKLGIDPTSPNLHLGRSVPILKMRDFQNLGHQAVLIVGDFTGVIGDTSDKDSERPMLSREAVEKNKKDYFAQIGKLIDLDKAELRYNSEWLEPLTYREIGEHADQFSVADFIARDNIKRRLDDGKRVSLREMLYPLMQGYDSVAVNSDVELGGVDQRFNLLSGRALQEHFKQEPQAIVMTTFPVLGLDGRKMSSSWGNTINFSDEPNEMFGKIMSMVDGQVQNYFEVCTRVSIKEIKKIMAGHPKEAKIRLAFEITKIYHGEETAKKAQENFTETFSRGGMPKDVKTVTAQQDEPLVEILLKEGLVSSKTEFNRLNKDGAIEEIESGVYRVGKHRFLKIVRSD
ncbi:MAG: tyrosine--tRNA ligase [Candidatus Zambryskibacteria bacterium RIFCSPHIGHO2_12_FULL_48_10]|uniref:Tyrosine--tRNA ligase n=1 Tax=Candidatus Zambryskibacteria bacterium RIFCSPHIGHO2_01_FULL_46_25 TaxID=1802738 RepID=A0A1G2SYC5_9BACT|nr:MAG: Tyrosine-tRNA ligase [Parcubacteria group bacterium GW2011_GWA1_47_10]OHA90037.1 MAG: tyrosine--tRNA ligase [Candidatus Zambryskibacteria bacterium RIFCSPHIGHO2_01_FULL_46_25]OHB00705.1 MAG: tyrosine--tRNA ligase [Candidatus Zambryskibacteria bacterium RIFCSPHIGHO2_12_FULL_48_10]OHB06589.1 MAG: tyrosine--tRNA ligase [Candidatus Zambryskibacteria bacterium RIFCSPLOWO2_01_FULL_48_25]